MSKSDRKEKGIGSFILRLVLVSVILTITSYLTPGFSITGLWMILLAGVVIIVIDYFVESVMKVDASPFGRGFKGFVIAAIILYLTQFIVPTMHVSIMGAIIAAVVIGILDAIIPGRFM